jgi:MscS family membrane protein
MNDRHYELLEQVYFGNTLENYLWFAGIMLIGMMFRHIISSAFSTILFRLIKKYSGQATAGEFHDLLKKPFSWFLFLIVAYIAVSHLSFPESWKTQPGGKYSPEIVFNILYQVVLIFSFTWIIMRMVDFFGLILLHRASKTESKLDDQLVPFFRDGLKIIVGILSFFFILASVFDVNIVTLIGGLGIGGLAVALAAKETLENLLGSFTIFLDKPFIVGDLVKVGAVNGHVESIGLRSTRIRTLEKSLVTVPNKKMVDAELENITERSLWRVRFSIGVLYSTQSKDLDMIIMQIRKALDNHEQISSDPTVRFDQFGSSSIDILISYLVITNEFTTVMKVKEEVNFAIMRIVRDNNTDFAFPSTSVYMEKMN